MDIGHRMKELRIQYGLTQQELATVPSWPRALSHSWNETRTLRPSELFWISSSALVRHQQNFYRWRAGTDCFQTGRLFWKNRRRKTLLYWMGRSQCTEKPDGTGSSDFTRWWTVRSLSAPWGEDFGYVIKGNVRIHYAGQNQTVHAGESFYFKAGKSIIWKTPVRQMPSSSGWLPHQIFKRTNVWVNI